MTISHSKGLKIYFAIYLILVGLIWLVFGNKGQSYDQNKLETMMTSQSRFLILTNDPCQYQLVGDPNAGDQYVKLNIKCGSKVSKNTFDLRAVKDQTIGGLLTEFERINGVRAERNKYKCEFNGLPVTNWAIKLTLKSVVECRYE